MKTIPLFVLVVTAASALGQGGTQDVSPPAVTFDCSASKPQVIIGTNSTGMFTVHMTWPWMALIGRKQGQDIDWVCPGMLINKQWVLTSALCIFDQSPMVVRLGEYDYDDDLDGADHQDFSVVENVTYPEYLGTQGYHSLMLVKLDSIVSFEKYISPVCLPWGEESNRNITDQKALVLTYGNTISSGTRNTVQKEIELTVFPVALCDVNYSKLPSYTFKLPQGIGRETLCAGDPDGGKDACIGDSGGPLMTVGADGRYVVAGIVSSGYGCGIKEYPGLYNNLRYPPYLSWIKRIAFTTP